MEVNKKQFDKFLAAIKEKEVEASLGCDGWIILNRTCKHSLTICAQSCAHFKSTPLFNYELKSFSIIRLDCHASGQPVKLCEISLKEEEK